MLDGITVGGHKLSDERQVFNLRRSWHLLIDYVGRVASELSSTIMNSINSKVAEEEALAWGSFREGPVFTGGTKKYRCPPAGQLNPVFANDITKIKAMKNPVERAITFFLWGSLNQFYHEGKKRTSRLMANGIMLSEGIGVFNTPASLMVPCSALIVEFYDTKDAPKISGFFEESCLVAFA